MKFDCVYNIYPETLADVHTKDPETLLPVVCENVSMAFSSILVGHDVLQLQKPTAEADLLRRWTGQSHITFLSGETDVSLDAGSKIRPVGNLAARS